MGPRTVAARRRFFGDDSVDERGRIDPHRVLLSWFGVAGFALAIGGEVVLLDAWVPRGTTSPRRTTPTELAALRPAAILIGHGHFDHAADLEAVLAATDATLVAAPPVIDRARRRLKGRPLHAVEAVPPDAPAGTVSASDLPGLPDVTVTTLIHHHSRLRPPTGTRWTVTPRPDPSVLRRHRPRLRDLAHLAAHLPDRCGPSVAYRIERHGFALVWHDTTGPLDPHAPEVLAALRCLGPADVQVTAIQTFNQLTNGLRDVATYVEAVRPRLLVPCHHDDWLPPITAPGARYAAPLDRVLAELPVDARPEVRFLRDPDDYLTAGRLSLAPR
jgi:L-ascorbate metabolism protein UlaG (beta-lactamase superfamily)